MSELLLFRRREECEQRQGSERGGGGKNATNREANSASVLGSTLSSFDDLYELVYLHVVVRLPRKHLMTLPIFFPLPRASSLSEEGCGTLPHASVEDSFLLMGSLPGDCHEPVSCWGEPSRLGGTTRNDVSKLLDATERPHTLEMNSVVPRGIGCLGSAHAESPLPQPIRGRYEG